ncbi:MAG: tetraacyldisaccharide 4'-kinase, partial [Nitrospiraceae bacterium]
MRPLLQVLALPYGLVVRARNLLYDRGWKRIHRLPCRVVSVGNMTVGGTGKTPVVIWIVDYLLSRGLRVGVLSRGYRRKGPSPHLLVSDGRALLAGATEAGDEPFLIASRCRDAVVAVGADRSRVGRWMLNQFPLDYLVLDDGFQHRAVHRDVDVLLVDASDPHGLRALLPAGCLREPLSAVRRASSVLLTRADPDRDLAAVRALLSAAGGAETEPVLVRFDVEGYVDLAGGAFHGLEDAVDRRALIFSGVGNSASFRRLVTNHGVKVAEELVFPDHHAYTKVDWERVREQARRCGADVLLTTEKDAVKIVSLMRPEETVWAARLRT